MYADTLSLSPPGESPEISIPVALSYYGEYLAALCPADESHPPLAGIRPVVEFMQTMADKLYAPEAGNTEQLDELGRYGKTIVTSDGLCMAGLAHYICLYNTRSGILVPAAASHGNTDLHIFSDNPRGRSGKDLINPLEATPLSACLVNGSIADIEESLELQDSAEVMIDATRLAAAIRANIDSVCQHLLWPNPFSQALLKAETDALECPDSTTTATPALFAMRIFEPALGQKMLLEQGTGRVPSLDAPLSRIYN